MHFLFSGSQRHLLLALFSDAKKPFYNLVDQLHLQPLDLQVYSQFIEKQFAKDQQKISAEHIAEILQWTRGHTFYTQYFCNRLFAKQHQEINAKGLLTIKDEILFSFEPNYLQILAALSKNQGKLLSAIAQERSVTGVNQRAFLTKYDMAQSSAAQALQVLIEKELLYEKLQKDQNEIFVYDPYLANWLREYNR